MRFIKKLDIFVLKNFLMLFSATFFICLFVLMMQFLWKWVDELVGKGLSMDVLAQFFLLSSETLVPMAMPLAILLASLISFGNMGERLELLAIKAAGIPLLRTMAPLVTLCSMLAGVSFVFQNNIGPKAQLDLMRLVYTIRQKSPELDIPEGVFYNGVEGLNLYVREKNKETGMLYNVVIYNMRDGVNKAHIILSDSAFLESSSDKTCMLLHLYNGEQFENLNDSPLRTNNVPYRRETFVEKHLIIDFDQNFNLTDADGFATSANTKNMKQLLADADSLIHYYDSLSVEYTNDMHRQTLNITGTTQEYNFSVTPPSMRPDSVPAFRSRNLAEKTTAVFKHKDNPEPFDTLVARLSPDKYLAAVNSAIQRVSIQKMDGDYKTEVMEYGNQQVRRHWIQIWEKITMSLACLVFFFIGAPLGAIIRKGGLGMPVVVSVLIFIFYYIINTSGMKLGREGTIPVWVGMWISTFVLAPIGAFISIKSNNDSVVFNIDAYNAFFRRLMGIRQKRHIVKKEVIINDPDYTAATQTLADIMLQCEHYIEQHKGRRHPLGYLWYILRRPDESAARLISERLEALVEELSNSKDRHVLLLLNGFPIMMVDTFRFYRWRRTDMKNILRYGDLLLLRIEQLTGTDNSELQESLSSAFALGESIEDEDNL